MAENNDSNPQDSTCHWSNSTGLTVRSSSTFHTVWGTIAFVLVWPLIAFHVRKLGVGRVTAALIGALAMVVGQVVPQSDVYSIVGEESRLKTIFLLIGMMLLAELANKQGLVVRMAKNLLVAAAPLKRSLWRICFFSAASSWFITNDATCVLITPVLLSEHKRQGRHRAEVLPLCLAIATSANLGSAGSVFGNPQNAFISARTGLTLVDAMRALLPAALLGVIINTALLYVGYWEYVNLRPHLPDLASRENSCQASVEERVPAAREESIVQDNNCCHVNLKRKVLIIVLALSCAATVIMLALPKQVATFDLGLVPVGAAIIVMATASFLFGSHDAVIQRIDWTLVMLFWALFVWLEGFERTGFPCRAFRSLHEHMGLNTPSGITVFSLFVLIGSNIVSNVPMVILLVDKLVALPGGHDTQDPFPSLLLAWTSTVAGNLTLMGSVANLIVAEKSQASLGRAEMTFFKYLKFSWLSTAIVFTLGCVLVYALQP